RTSPTGNSATVLKPGGESNQRQGGSEFDAPFSSWNPTQLLTSDYLAVSRGKLQAKRTKTRSEETGQAFESKIAACCKIFGRQRSRDMSIGLLAYPTVTDSWSTAISPTFYLPLTR